MKKWKLTATFLLLPVLFFLVGISPAFANTAGYTTIGASQYFTGSSGNTNPPGLMITVAAGGSLTKITAYVANSVSSNSSNASIYAGSAGARGALIASTNLNTVTTSFGWVDFTFSSPVTVSATTYWIQFNGDGGNGPGGNVGEIAYDTGGAANTGYTLTDIGNPQYNTSQYSMYATYTPTAPPAPSTSQANIQNGKGPTIINGSIKITP